MNTLYPAIPQTQEIPSKANNIIQIRVYIEIILAQTENI